MKGVTFDFGKVTNTTIRDYVDCGSGFEGDPMYLIRVGYRTSPYYLLHAAWFLIVTALRRMVPA